MHGLVRLPQGLVVTNHHCARGSVQFNSTEENNYLADGFLAASFADELPAAPGTRVYVTVDVKDVTDLVTGELGDDLTGRERFDRIDARRKALISQCEEKEGHRCQVSSFFGGLQYKLIDRLEIRDVRIAYAPADAIGKYGGDIDNWQWPRHTGDFAFYRAYVGPDGKPADFAEDNVPYQPEHVLKVSAAGLEDGDFVMAAGYPGSTSRYARAVEVENTFTFVYPTFQTLLNAWVATIEDAAPEGSDARIKYESRLAGLNNFAKNLVGQLDGARRVNLVERRTARDAALTEWVAGDRSRRDLAAAIDAVDALAVEGAQAQRANWGYSNAGRSQMLSTAKRLYRLATEKQKPDAQREGGFQERDMTFFRQGLSALDRRFDVDVEKAEWTYFLNYYVNETPAESRVPAMDAALGLDEAVDADALAATLDRFYAETTLTDAEARLAWMEASPQEFEASEDPFIQLAVALFDHDMELEAASKDRSGRSAALRPAYMEAIIAWQESQGKQTYPDANSTLRITYGSVMGGRPRDGMLYEPFTRLEGILEKDTGLDPFNSPQSQLDLIEAGAYGDYELASIGSVPVNFLSDLDSTGGNSGSATLNARGELVGLLFDGTIESVNSDWDFDPSITRTIHVDTRYMLWVMENVDGADALIGEMEIVR